MEGTSGLQHFLGLGVTWSFETTEIKFKKTCSKYVKIIDFWMCPVCHEEKRQNMNQGTGKMEHHLYQMDMN